MKFPDDVTEKRTKLLLEKQQKDADDLVAFFKKLEANGDDPENFIKFAKTMVDHVVGQSKKGKL